MNISTTLGILTATIGILTAAYKGYEYLKSPERTRKERIGISLVVLASVIIVVVASSGLSFAASKTPIGKQPVPLLPTAAPVTATPMEQPTQGASPAPGATDTPASTPTLTPNVTPSPTPILGPTSSPVPTDTPPATPTATSGVQTPPPISSVTPGK